MNLNIFDVTALTIFQFVLDVVYILLSIDLGRYIVPSIVIPIYNLFFFYLMYRLSEAMSLRCADNFISARRDLPTVKLMALLTRVFIFIVQYNIFSVYVIVMIVINLVLDVAILIMIVTKFPLHFEV